MIEINCNLDREDLILIKNILESKSYAFKTKEQDKLRRKIIKAIKENESKMISLSKEGD